MKQLLIFILCLVGQAQAQDLVISNPVVISSFDSLAPSQTLVGQSNSSYIQALLPHKMLATQRIFWGPKGLLRLANIAPLTTEGRRNELKVRQFMMISHQVTGYITLAGYLAQGILTVKLNNATGDAYNQLYSTQRTITTITNIAYGTTALLSLTAPPRESINPKRGSSIRLHKYLSIVHLTGFVVTNILGAKANQHSELTPYRQAATLTTFAALAPALIALKF